MKKVGIITIVDDNNYGNRLQNYALQETIKKMGYNTFTLKNYVRTNCKNSSFKIKLLFILKKFQNGYQNLKRYKRYKLFKGFNKNVDFYNKTITAISAQKIEKDFDYFVAGSDQVWNLNFRRSTYIDMLEFTEKNKKISYAPSFGTNSIPDSMKKNLQEALNSFKAISVREDAGREIIKSIAKREDAEVLVDPTMLLTAEEWDKVSVKPKQLKAKKYILNYFLGNLSANKRKEIERIAKENDCEIIDILDKKNPLFITGPSEFLYLEKNAFLICTDSFHSSVFAIIYNRPFIIFDREGNGHNMNSRLDTLLSKFKLKDRKYNGGSITKENLNHNYAEAYEILENEKEKSINFLKKALEI